MQLPRDLFLTVVGATPLVSIDLVIRNAEGQVLLGRRKNRPARGYWFVPGGRIFKNERVEQAMRRISQAEIGVAIDDANLLGVFDHIYPDNFWGEEVNTHYVVLGYTYLLPAGTEIAPDDQHDALQWWTVEALLDSPEVHENTKAYFRSSPELTWPDQGDGAPGGR